MPIEFKHKPAVASLHFKLYSFDFGDTYLIKKHPKKGAFLLNGEPIRTLFELI